MTREEKVFDILDKWEFFYGQRAGRELWGDKPKAIQDQDIADFNRDMKIVRSALRPVSREQVEKVWGVRAWETVADEGFVDTMGRQVFHLHCPVCDFFWRETGHKKYFRFCPHCGAPMTGEAAEMVMERLEALKGD